MLSVIRELAEEAEARARRQPAIGELLVDLVRRGEAAVARTPEQLQVLRDAGVVDAGGAGLLELVRGVAAAVSGEALPEAPAGGGAPRRRGDPPGALALPLLHRVPDRGGRTSTARRSRSSSRRSATRCSSSATRPRSRCTCTPTIPAPRSRSAAPPGRSTASRSRTCTSRRSSGRSACSRRCPTRRRARDDRRRRGRRRRRQPPSLREPRQDVGPIAIVEGGQTMNPSTADLLAAVQSLDADEVVILPNNSNVLLAAEHAAANADRPVEVVAADSIPGGLAAMVAFDGTAHRRRERGRDARGRRGGRHGRGDDRLARRRDERRLDPQGRLARALHDGEPIAGGDELRRGRGRPSSTGCSHGRATC